MAKLRVAFFLVSSNMATFSILSTHSVWVSYYFLAQNRIPCGVMHACMFISIIYSQFHRKHFTLKNELLGKNFWFSFVHLNCNLSSVVSASAVAFFHSDIYQKKAISLNWGEMRVWTFKKDTEREREMHTDMVVFCVSFVMKYVVMCLMKY